MNNAQLNITDVFEHNQHLVAMLNVINRARLFPPKSGGHKHHIIPRSWYRMHDLPVDNSKENLVLLTLEDHVKVHKYAYFCCVSKMKRSMACAYLFLVKSEMVANNPKKGAKKGKKRK